MVNQSQAIEWPKCVLPPEDERAFIQAVIDNMPMADQIDLANRLLAKNGLPPLDLGKAESK